MSAWLVVLVTLCATLGGAFLAVVLARRAPEDFLSDDTRYTLKVTVGLTAAVTSLILGLMITSVRFSYSEAADDVEKYAVAILQADVELRDVGAAACPVRDLLKDYVRLILKETWEAPASGARARFETESTTQLLRMNAAARQFPAASQDERASRDDVLTSLKTLLTHRWKLSSDAVSRIPDIFILVVVGWLMLIFFSFGWFAPRNPLGLGALSLSALCITSALFLIVEMGEPFSGPMRVSPGPLRDALHAMQAAPCEAGRSQS